MAWARIHDSALSSPKVVGMFNPRDPFHLWIWGLSYCQLHLTDGAIPREAVPHGGDRAAATLIGKRLWETADGGYQVHDYLDWNDSREVITKKRDAARSRMSVARERSREQHQRTKQEQQPRTSTDVLRGVASSSSDRIIDLVSNQQDPEGERERKPLGTVPDARSKRPIFTGNRLTVFEWMLDECTRILGPHTEQFRLDEWFDVLDRSMVSRNLLMPKRDSGAWLQSELVAECNRRGILIRIATPATLGKQTNRLAAAIASLSEES